ncbi:MAG: hypothetical protein JW924_07100 [Fusobacteriaceae bacterium]|nr:hypothetical protein [Fusobacteriaceae bacterium]
MVIGIAYISNDGIYGRIDTEFRGKINYFDGANDRTIEIKGGVLFNAKVGYKLTNCDIYCYVKKYYRLIML